MKGKALTMALPFFQRWIRGILCDVWIAEKDTALGYRTTELFFTRNEWNFFVEEINTLQQVPIGIATYYADKVIRAHLHISSKLQVH